MRNLITTIGLFVFNTQRVNVVGFAYLPCPHPLQQNIPRQRIFVLNENSFEVRDAIHWIANEPLELLLPKKEVLQICDELMSSKELIDDMENEVQKNWGKIEEIIRQEPRSIQELLGKETTERVLKTIKTFEIYDSDSVRAFLGSEAVNELFAKVLYDGIYEFFQTIDVFGNLIGNLPIIGPLRNQIRDEIKRNLDRALGPLLQSFLRSYTKVAILQASDFVMSPTNRKAFGNANARLVSSIVQRPLSSLLPTTSDWAEKLRKDAFDYIRNNDNLLYDLERYLDFVYDILGDKRINQALDVERIVDSSPTLEKRIEWIWSTAIKKTKS